jgi:NTP pyrophosphatase (non-canonical NTP hydrolase)
MDITEYHAAARSTAIYPESARVMYPALGLAGEVGEVCEKIKKVVRDGSGEFTAEKKLEIVKELGDVLWYVANLAEDLGSDLESVAMMNVAKLQSRKERGVLQGNGDNR